MVNIAHRATMIIAIAGMGVSTAVNADSKFESLRVGEVVGALQRGELVVECPDFQNVISQVVTTQTPGAGPNSVRIRGIRPVNGAGPLPLVDGMYPPATGVEVTVDNTSNVEQLVFVEALCGRPEFGAGGATIASVINLASRGFGKGYADCPPDYFATGGGYHAKGLQNAEDLQILSDYPFWSNGPPLSSRPDGLHEAPTGWGVDVDNSGDTDQLLTNYSYCLPNTSLLVRTKVESRFVGDNLVFHRQTARDNDYAIGIGVSGGPDVHDTTGAAWQPRENFGAGGWTFSSFFLDQGTIRPGGSLGHFFTRAPGTFSRSAAAGPAVEVKMALIITPSTTAAPPVNIVQAIEFYHAASDHYFITAIAKEISDLDNKVHPGWQRTGQSFKVYAAGSGGPPDRFPVCRFYGLPQAGLDSHFYTGGVLECLEVLTKFAGAWDIESGEVFQILIPDVDTGACPTGTIPVMRSWNQRTDSNHRYTIVAAIRDSMVKDHGHTPEGYGPNAVVFCALA